MDTQVAPFFLEALRAARPAPEVTPLGYIFHSTDTLETFVRAINPVTNLPQWDAISGSGTGGLPFLVGPAGQAPYQKFANALADAQAAGARVVYALAATYSENFTLPANMEIYGLGETPAVLIQGNIAINGVNGTNALRNVKVNGRVSFRTNTGGPTTATLQFDHVIVAPAAMAALLVSDSTGLTITALDSDFTGGGNPGFNTNVAVTMTAKRCSFTGDAANPGLIASGGTITLVDCTHFGNPIRSLAATVFDFTNFQETLVGTLTPALDMFAGSTANIHQWIQFVNQIAAGRLNIGGTVVVDTGVNLGTYQVANLPTGTIAPGAVAFCNNMAGAVAPVYFGNSNWRRYSDNSVAS